LGVVIKYVIDKTTNKAYNLPFRHNKAKIIANNNKINFKIMYFRFKMMQLNKKITVVVDK